MHMRIHAYGSQACPKAMHLICVYICIHVYVCTYIAYTWHFGYVYVCMHVAYLRLCINTCLRIDRMCSV